MIQSYLLLAYIHVSTINYDKEGEEVHVWKGNAWKINNKDKMGVAI